MKTSDIFWQTYLNLEKEVVEVSKFIFFTDEILINSNGSVIKQACKSQLETFSPHIADLLIRCCVQIEAISKELYFENGGKKTRGDNSILFDEDCLKLIDMKWKTHNKIVMCVAPFFNLTKEENRILRPLKEAHKRQGTYWERAYQAVKHDRYFSLHRGNIKALLNALAALYLLNIYYRNDTWFTKRQGITNFDYSMGSAIFSVKAPVTSDNWNENEPVHSESPYVVCFKEEAYQRIKEMQKEEEQALKNYLISQPEVNELEFQKQIQKVSENNKNTNITTFFIELGKYRINKKIPQDLSFKEKKYILVNSNEWKGWIHQNNKHLLEHELTEENIQKEIEHTGIHWGLEIMKKYEKLEWVSYGLNKETCKVYIP